MKVTKFHSERLTFTPLDSSFASEEYLSWLNNTAVNKYLDFDGSYSFERLRAYLKEVERSEMLFWAIIVTKSGKHIGNIKVDPIDWTNKSGEYGIMMGDNTEWRKGFALEASRAVIDHCFGPSIGLVQITLGVFSENTAAIRLYEKLGFEVYEKKTGYNYSYKEERDSLRMSMKR